jgi:C-terminal processing protease CtpA/Prc
VAEKVEQLRAALPAYSSERIFLATAHERLLHGEKGSAVNVTFLPPDGEAAVQAELQRPATMPSGRSWQYRAMPFPTEQGKFLWTGRLPSGYGYIRIVSFERRDDIADEFDRALEELKHTPGLIIDVRDNHDGSGASQARIIGRLTT